MYENWNRETSVLHNRFKIVSVKSENRIQDHGKGLKVNEKFQKIKSLCTFLVKILFNTCKQKVTIHQNKTLNHITLNERFLRFCIKIWDTN